ncbi:hypothetical protein EYF80_026746 [Liparis tanakae]|uniref:Uncharacterized protein n=1 Tax=Liparis tanakae TaxID=230148 RepID=A0A4Z2HAW4_9TELE|nr:hypothetical protein EYF80_026746 [Liparis tanakae]
MLTRVKPASVFCAPTVGHAAALPGRNTGPTTFSCEKTGNVRATENTWWTGVAGDKIDESVIYELEKNNTMSSV